MKIELIRHGRTKLQEEHKYQGWTDAPLSEEGMKELQKASYAPDLLFVSPLIRACQTAEILFPGVRQMVRPGLKEMNFGAFEGQSFQELNQNKEYCSWVQGMCEGRCTDGETKEEFSARVNRAFQELLLESEQKKAKSIAVVAHGGTLMSVMDRYCRDGRSYFDYSTESGTGYLLESRGDGAEIILELIQKTDYRRG